MLFDFFFFNSNFEISSYFGYRERISIKTNLIKRARGAHIFYDFEINFCWNMSDWRCLFHLNENCTQKAKTFSNGFPENIQNVFPIVHTYIYWLNGAGTTIIYIWTEPATCHSFRFTGILIWSCDWLTFRRRKKKGREAGDTSIPLQFWQ